MCKKEQPFRFTFVLFFFLVPSFNNIGCFKIPKTGFKEVLAYPNKDYDPANFNSYILECADLAFDKGYSHFALGDKGKCLSSSTAKNNYYAKGAAAAKDCKNGIGIKFSIQVYTFGEFKVKANE